MHFKVALKQLVTNFRRERTCHAIPDLLRLLVLKGRLIPAHGETVRCASL